jgi:hypothetical protein
MVSVMTTLPVETQVPPVIDPLPELLLELLELLELPPELLLEVSQPPELPPELLLPESQPMDMEHTTKTINAWNRKFLFRIVLLLSMQ